MANTINLITKYVPLLDEVYKKGLVTSGLEGNSALVREANTANAVMLPKITTQGLADYDKASGFVSGNANLTWETHTFTQDRGREFNVDNADNKETAGIAFGALSGDFVSTKVVPETDAYRFATLFDNAKTTKEKDLTVDNVEDEIDDAIEKFDEDNVPVEGRILYMSPSAYKVLKQSQSDKFSLVPGQSPNKQIAYYDEIEIVKTPQSRFYSAITLYDGSTDGQEAGGYIKYGSDFDEWEASTAYSADDLIINDGYVYKAKAGGTSGSDEPTWTQDGEDISDGTGDLVWVYQEDAGRDINFELVHPSAVIPIVKINTPRMFEPNVNQSADAYKFQLRLYHDCFVFENKTAGIYANYKTS